MAAGDLASVLGGSIKPISPCVKERFFNGRLPQKGDPQGFEFSILVLAVFTRLLQRRDLLGLYFPKQLTCQALPVSGWMPVCKA